MPIRVPLRYSSLALACVLAAFAARPAVAGLYPTNACVSTKQRDAARYCEKVLRAWARWERSQADGPRDQVIAREAARLDVRWARADATALAKGSDCSETTIGAADLRDFVDTAASDLVAALNGGLDLGNAADARCGRHLLDAAAGACRRLLRADSRHVKRPERDPHRTRLADAQDAARARLARVWDRVVTQQGCPTTSTDFQDAVDALAAAVVRDTIISPHVSATQYDTISPTGSTDYQGRSFTPVCMNGTPYHFFAKRGTVNKLVMYYQGGGACWENLTCTIPTCDTNVNPAGGDNPNGASSGFGDLTNAANPFKDWNAVFVSYCSCDVHFGDAAQDYSGLFPTIHVEHRGFHNAKVAEKWAREHFVDPEVVFVTGSSAGAYGAWFNGPLLHEVWPASRFQVLADAGNGVITQDFLDNEFPHWNFAANLPADPPELSQVLLNGTGIPGYTEVVANFLPETRWAHYSSAFDGSTGGQTGFYHVMLNPTNPTVWSGWWLASCAFNATMRSQAIATAATVPSNYRYYIGTGSRHTMWGSNKVYTDTTGGVPTIVDWVNGMLDGSAAWTNVECTDCGLLLSGDPRPSPLQSPFFQQGADVRVVCP